MRLLLVLVSVLVLASSAPALGAAGHNAPPGNSGVDQYLESIPSAQGGTPVRDALKGQRRQVLPAQTRRQLNAFGKDGQRAARLAEATAPASALAAARSVRKRRAKLGGKQLPARPPVLLSAAPRSPGSEAVRALTGGGSGGLGIGLPLLLIGGGVAVVSIRLLRPRPR